MTQADDDAGLTVIAVQPVERVRPVNVNGCGLAANDVRPAPVKSHAQPLVIRIRPGQRFVIKEVHFLDSRHLDATMTS